MENNSSSAASKPFAPSAALNKIGSVTRLETGPVHLPQFFQFLVGENRLLQTDQRATVRLSA